MLLTGSVLKHYKVQKYYDQDCRFGVPSTTSLVQKTILFLQALQQWTPSLSLQTSPFKKFWLRYWKYAKTPFFKIRHKFLENFFFLSTIAQWNKLYHNIKSCSSFNIFRKSIGKFIRPSANSFFFQQSWSQRNQIYHKSASWFKSLKGVQIQT